MSLKNSYVLGVRCKNTKLELLYITTEAMDEEAVTAANTVGVKMRVRVDDNAVADLEGVLDDVDGKAVAIADLETELASSIRDGKKRVAVVLEIMGKNFHENTFNLRGSTDAVGKVVAACVKG